MTKIVEAKEVIEISHYIDFKKSILEYVKNGDIHKAVVIYDEFFKSENLFPLSDVSPVESLKTHVAILINSFLELSIESGIPDFIAFSKGQTLIRMLSQKTDEEECIKMGKISIWGFGQQISLAGDKNNSELIKKALFYIHEHLDEKISLQEVADHVYLTKTYFSALFKDHVHMSFTDYINLSKINRSKYYLTHTDKSVNEIADILGFNSQGYFTNVFKKYSNCSPKDYQLQWRRSTETLEK